MKVSNEQSRGMLKLPILETVVCELEQGGMPGLIKESNDRKQPPGPAKI